MVNTRASELTEFNALLRRAAYLHALAGDGRDPEIVINNMITIVDMPPISPSLEVLRTIVQRLAAKVGASETDTAATAL